MESIKSYLVDGGGSGNSDLATMLAMNGGGMNGMWNNPLWAIVFLAALGNGNLFGNGNGGCRNGNANVDFVSSQLGNAIAGNANAISNLATQLNCSEAQVQNTLTNMMTGISTLANTLGQSTLGIQNAINSGNMNIANQLCNCCCEMRQTVTNQGYENQIRTLEQTNNLQNGLGQIRQDIASMGAADTLAICQQTNGLNENSNRNTQQILAKLDSMTTQSLMDKLDAARTENTALKGEISQGQQNQYFAGLLAQALNPVNAQLSVLGKEIEAIKACQPNTINVPYPNVQAVSTTPWMGSMYGAGYNGFWG